MITKIREDADNWFLAQQVDKEEVSKGLKSTAGTRNFWRPPERPWLKCNFAYSWDKHKLSGGAAWVLRNWEGTVLLHSRRAFSSVVSKLDAEFECWLWVLESMKSLKIRKVIFAAEASHLMEAVLRPDAWPSFKYHSELVLKGLVLVPSWKLHKEDKKANNDRRWCCSRRKSVDVLDSSMARLDLFSPPILSGLLLVQWVSSLRWVVACSLGGGRSFCLWISFYVRGSRLLSPRWVLESFLVWFGCSVASLVRLGGASGQFVVRDGREFQIWFFHLLGYVVLVDRFFS
ncbi:unnamed protein product [Arabidopsis halleri]